MDGMTIAQVREFAAQEAVKGTLPSFPARPLPDRIARLIDHTLLKPEATPAQIEQLCNEALEYQFATVCVNPVYVPLCARLLGGSPVGVAMVAGFPLGASRTASKAAEAKLGMEEGASEVDMVLPIGLLRAGEYQAVQDDIQAVAEAVHAGGGHLKVIFETCFLDTGQKIAACLLSRNAGADYVKTSTGFGPSGATLEDVALMRAYAKPPVLIKAAGGIRSVEQALAFYQAGADRLGTSSGVKIAAEYQR